MLHLIGQIEKCEKSIFEKKASTFFARETKGVKKREVKYCQILTSKAEIRGGLLTFEVET